MIQRTVKLVTLRGTWERVRTSESELRQWRTSLGKRAWQEGSSLEIHARRGPSSKREGTFTLVTELRAGHNVSHRSLVARTRGRLIEFLSDSTCRPPKVTVTSLTYRILTTKELEERRSLQRVRGQVV